MWGLGRNFDIIPLVAPVDLMSTTPGSEIFSLRDAKSVDIVFFAGDGTDGDDIDFTIKEHEDLDDGTGQALALGNLGNGVDHYFKKEHATDIHSATTWSKVSSFGDADGVVTIPDPSAQSQGMYVFHIEATELSKGYSALSVALQDVGSNAKLGCAFAILNDLAVQRSPENLRSAVA